MTRKPIELRTKEALEEARYRALGEDQHRLAVEAEIAFHPKRVLTPLEKFRAIKPTGASDGFSVWDLPDLPPAFPPPPPTEPPVGLLQYPSGSDDASGYRGVLGQNAIWLFLILVTIFVILYYK